jgi:hypothetical protein
MTDAPTIQDSASLFKLLTDLENRARVYADDDPSDPRGKVYGTVVTQLKKALEEGQKAEPWTSPSVLSDRLGVPVDTIRSWARANRIPWRRIEGSRLLQVRYPNGGAN